MLSPNCECAHPYTGIMHFFSFSFSDLQNLTYYTILHGVLMSEFRSRGIPVDSLNITNPNINSFSYLELTLLVFPSGKDVFDRTSVSNIGYVLNRQQFPIQYFGPFFFLDEQYCCLPGKHPKRKRSILYFLCLIQSAVTDFSSIFLLLGLKKSTHVGVIIGVAIGGSFLVLMIFLAGVYALRQKKRAKQAIVKSNPFGKKKSS